VIFCSFGDMLRVPGSESDLLVLKSRGADVRVVYSPMDCLKIARPIRTRRSSSSPSVSRRPRRATRWPSGRRAAGHRNFSVLVSHVLVPPAMAAILQSPLNRVQGFLGPGHVCTVMGYEEYEPLAERFRVPIVITGFEPLDLLKAR
jgi:hydrogenase expression/formation protein HypD